MKTSTANLQNKRNSEISKSGSVGYGIEQGFLFVSWYLIWYLIKNKNMMLKHYFVQEDDVHWALDISIALDSSTCKFDDNHMNKTQFLNWGADPKRASKVALGKVAVGAWNVSKNRKKCIEKSLYLSL